MPVRTMTELESEGRVISVSHGKSSVTTVAARCTASTTVRGLPRTGLGSGFAPLPIDSRSMAQGGLAVGRVETGSSNLLWSIGSIVGDGREWWPLRGHRVESAPRQFSSIGRPPSGGIIQFFLARIAR